MAVYKFFPTKDAFITSDFPNMNTGLDSSLSTSYTNKPGSGIISPQVQIFNEDVGNNEDGFTPISLSKFKNSGLYTYSGNADTRLTQTSSRGYVTATGKRDIFFTNNAGTYFTMSGISTLNFTNISLSFGAWKYRTDADFSDFIVDYSTDGGISWTSLPYPPSQVGTGSSVWRNIDINNTGIPSVSDLSLRWTNNSDYTYYRIDDIVLLGTMTLEASNTEKILLGFDKEAIDLVKDNLTNGMSCFYNLKLFTSKADNLCPSLFIDVYNIPAGNQFFWTSGLGKYGDVPENREGVNWNSLDGTNPWPSPNLGYQGGMSDGTGGVWNLLPFTQQEITLYKPSDINVDVTKHVSTWPVNNNGMIMFVENYLSTSYISSSISFFSRDTNSIYPPYLEMKWDDSDFTGQVTSSILNNSEIVCNIRNNKGKFYQDSINKFRINCREKYPTRVYQTSSIYNINYYLPSGATYAVKDVYTNEYVIDFDPNFTLISADSESNYFTLYMNGLEPERIYRILLKYEIDGSEIIIDPDSKFKITNG